MMRAVALVILMPLATLAADHVPTYSIKLNRPLHTGDILNPHETFDARVVLS